jgi:hypothetical protein
LNSLADAALAHGRATPVASKLFPTKCAVIFTVRPAADQSPVASTILDWRAAVAGDLVADALELRPPSVDRLE